MDNDMAISASLASREIARASSRSGRTAHGRCDRQRLGATWFLRAALLIGAIGLTVLTPQVGYLQAETVTADYKLGPQDKLRIKVFEWRATRDEVFEWTAYNSEFSINGAGRLALPFIGELPAAGLTTAQLGRSIGEALRSRKGLAVAPDATVEVVQFRPFYVTGHIDKPGEYPYRPGLTVLQATAIAGGVQRTPEQGMMRLEREAIATRGELQLYSKEFVQLLARTARLASELEGATTIEFPAALKTRSTDDQIASLMAQEKLIHRSRVQAFDTQAAALEGLKSFLEDEIVSLKGQLEAHELQVKSMQKDLEAVKTLVRKGLAIAPRQNATERAVAQLIGDRLRLEGNLMRARQELSRTNIALIELRNKRSTESTTELRAAYVRMDELKQRSEIAQQLLQETELIAPIYVSSRARGGENEPRFVIFRVRNGKAIEISASEGMQIEPGDTIKVEKPQARTEAVVNQVLSQSKIFPRPRLLTHPAGD